MEALTQRAGAHRTATPAQQNLYHFHNPEMTEQERARLVACSVEKATREGIVIRPYGPVGKLMVDDAAELSGIPSATLKRYLKAWNLAAIAGYCESSGALRPEDGQTARLPSHEAWDTYWNLST